MKIREIEFNDPVFLAPMAGVADIAFRELAVNFGAAYTVTEMVSAKALTMGDKKSRELMKKGEGEGIFAIQLFGSDPVVMAEAAKIAMEYGPDIIDVNMGCPAPKVANNGAGSALMKDPVLAGKIVEKMATAVSVPITAKIRKGWDGEHVNAVEFSKVLEESGAAAITVHGRTRPEMYSGTVDLNTTATVKAAVNIPVIHSGDVKGAQSAAITFDKTNCDAVMIGRGALGNPWVFRQINAYLNDCRVIPPPSLEEKMAVMLNHVKKIIEYKGEYIAMREARHHAAYYTKGLKGGAKFRNEISGVETYRDLEKIVAKIYEENRE